MPDTSNSGWLCVKRYPPPKDGKPKLITGGRWGCDEISCEIASASLNHVEAAYMPDGDPAARWEAPHNGNFWFVPTHWMPMPLPPPPQEPTHE